MDIQVNKDQLNRVVIKWLNNHFGNLKPEKHKHYSSSVFYVNSDNETMMEYDKNKERVTIHYEYVWSKIESLFHLKYYETISILRVWLEETYKLEGVTLERGHWI